MSHLKEIEMRVVSSSASKGKAILFSDTDSTLQTLSNLQKLILQNLNLGQLPVVIQNCENLEILNVEDNNIVHFPGYMPNISNLILNGNRRIDLDQILSCLNPSTLQFLNIGSCNLSQLPSRIADFQKKENIYFGRTCLQKIPVELVFLERMYVTCKYIVK
ncbi:hypothetical protein [Xanthocytophaga agilis]|uniref:Uncharacterized protein n=1 Tax=Xanthocytophaga agilis TaxID=3048010 RepID=A0AAE3RCY8_9BACT|nr:hypothetical protein [Xanthocytophaga agilis]MDJ1506262.1 hypothetical protein [Xanthocytophaga agilis]